MTTLAHQHCVPCEGGLPPMEAARIQARLAELGGGWQLKPGLVGKLTKQFRFRDFVATMAFVNQIAKLAEQEGHHPDILIAYNQLTLELFTHAIHGLSDNDFILAAKIDRLKRPDENPSAAA